MPSHERDKAVQLLRQIIRKIVIRPGRWGHPALELHGDVPAALAYASGDRESIGLSQPILLVPMAGEEGLEPSTS